MWQIEWKIRIKERANWLFLNKPTCMINENKLNYCFFLIAWVKKKLLKWLQIINESILSEYIKYVNLFKNKNS